MYIVVHIHIIVRPTVVRQPSQSNNKKTIVRQRSGK